MTPTRDDSDTTARLDRRAVLIMTIADEKVAPVVFGSQADMAEYFAFCSEHHYGTILDLDGASLRVGVMVEGGEE